MSELRTWGVLNHEPEFDIPGAGLDSLFRHWGSDNWSWELQETCIIQWTWKTGKSSGSAPTMSRRSSLSLFESGPFSVFKVLKVMTMEIIETTKTSKKERCRKIAPLHFRIGASVLRKQLKRLQSMIPTGLHWNNKHFRKCKMQKDCFTWLRKRCVRNKKPAKAATKHDLCSKGTV